MSVRRPVVGIRDLQCERSRRNTHVFRTSVRFMCFQCDFLLVSVRLPAMSVDWSRGQAAAAAATTVERRNCSLIAETGSDGRTDVGASLETTRRKVTKEHSPSIDLLIDRVDDDDPSKKTKPNRKTWPLNDVIPRSLLRAIGATTAEKLDGTSWVDANNRSH